jgi:HEAT repeat protein
MLDYHIEKRAVEKQHGEKTDKAPELKEVVVWNEPSPQVRLAAVQAIASLKVTDALPALIVALERETSFNRLAIIRVIESFGKDAAPVCLGRIVPLPYDATTFNERRSLLLNNSTLAIIAGRLGDERCVPWLRQTLKLPRKELGRAKDLTEIYIDTVKLLGQFKVEQAARPLAELLSDARIDQLSSAIQSSLRQIGFAAARPLSESLKDFQLAPVFFRLLRDPNLRHASAGKMITKYLTHESDEVRYEAMETLGLYLSEKILDEYEIPKLEALLYDPMSEVRTGSQRWLKRIRDKSEGRAGK